ncbi:synapsin-1-like [Phyllostomus hastatus]|uniref:synapsin-1-like n=1 Tax=Phyllostomus hastatus TaxID=9423 RepID=UPI001E6859FE|nr:synapsin-1-like [Phyllostomus hastatus]
MQVQDPRGPQSNTPPHSPSDWPGAPPAPRQKGRPPLERDPPSTHKQEFILLASRRRDEEQFPAPLSFHLTPGEEPGTTAQCPRSPAKVRLRLPSLRRLGPQALPCQVPAAQPPAVPQVCLGRAQGCRQKAPNGPLAGPGAARLPPGAADKALPRMRRVRPGPAKGTEITVGRQGCGLQVRALLPTSPAGRCASRQDGPRAAVAGRVIPREGAVGSRKTSSAWRTAGSARGAGGRPASRPVWEGCGFIWE